MLKLCVGLFEKVHRFVISSLAKYGPGSNNAAHRNKKNINSKLSYVDLEVSLQVKIPVVTKISWKFVRKLQLCCVRAKNFGSHRGFLPSFLPSFLMLPSQVCTLRFVINLDCRKLISSVSSNRFTYVQRQSGSWSQVYMSFGTNSLPLP